VVAGSPLVDGTELAVLADLGLAPDQQQLLAVVDLAIALAGGADRI
jgi:hypothetical protein